MKDKYLAWQQFVPLLDRFNHLQLLEDKRPLLSHYTSIQTLEKIISLKEIWLSNPLFMNDMEEVRFGLNVGLYRFLDSVAINHFETKSERREILRDSFRHFYEQYERDFVYDTYIFCLSEHDPNNMDGRLSMWRGYGGAGTGAALVFDTSAITLIPDSPMAIIKVQYASAKDRHNIIDDIISEWGQIYQQSNLPDELLPIASAALLETLKYFSFSTKHDGFVEEGEWRVVYVRERDQKDIMKPYFTYVLGAQGVEPRLRFEFEHIPGVNHQDISLERYLHSIILGPSFSSALARKGIERMFEQNEAHALIPKLHVSSIPLRVK